MLSLCNAGTRLTSSLVKVDVPTSSRLQGRLIRGTVRAAFVIVSVDITSCVHPFVLVLITCRKMKSLSVYLYLERMLVFGDSIVVLKLAQISFSPSRTCIFLKQY